VVLLYAALFCVLMVSCYAALYLRWFSKSLGIEGLHFPECLYVRVSITWSAVVCMRTYASTHAPVPVSAGFFFVSPEKIL
jgi:hypothetical protein